VFDIALMVGHDVRMSADIELIQVITTCATRDDALRIARTLIDERLAACVQTSGPITSVYRWDGRIDTGEEWLCTAKTLRSLFPRIEARLRELHTYAQPEILAVPVVAVSEGYRWWLIAEVTTAR
jgi:periplasmic divalent cation tolerance protein